MKPKTKPEFRAGGEDIGSRAEAGVGTHFDVSALWAV